MRHVYSVARFVPDPARGEAINIGVLAGSDTSGEWSLRTVENIRRAAALDERGILPGVIGALTNVGLMMEKWTANPQLALDFQVGPQVSESWLRRLVIDSRNVLQFTEPLAVSADSADEAIEAVWDELVVEPTSKRFRFEKKFRALGAVKEALANHHVGAENILEKVVVRGQGHSAKFDFVIHDKSALQLAHCWSFQLPDKAALIEDIKAWAWTVRDIRTHGGSAISVESAFEVRPQIPITAIYVPAEQGDPTFEEALSAFKDQQVNVSALRYQDAALFAAGAQKVLQH